jgi:hypothetical protein
VKSVLNHWISGAKQKNERVQSEKDINNLVKILKFQGVHLHPLTYKGHPLVAI